MQFSWCAHKFCCEKHFRLPTFVTSRNFTVTTIGTPSSSAVVRTCRAPTASAELQRLLMNEIHSYDVDLENYPSQRLSSAKPTTIHTSIFGKPIRLNFTDPTHIKHIYVLSSMRPQNRVSFENSMNSVTTACALGRMHEHDRDVGIRRQPTAAPGHSGAAAPHLPCRWLTDSGFAGGRRARAFP
jgi:hypothetical protein